MGVPTKLFPITAVLKNTTFGHFSAVSQMSGLRPWWTSKRIQVVPESSRSAFGQIRIIRLQASPTRDPLRRRVYRARARHADSLIGRKDTGEDIHESGFSGAILAEEGMDLAGSQIEIDAA